MRAKHDPTTKDATEEAGLDELRKSVISCRVMMNELEVGAGLSAVPPMSKQEPEE